MAKGTPTKKERNQKLVQMKAKMTFAKLARVFNISETRAKQIYYREVEKMKGGRRPLRNKKRNNSSI